MQSRVTPASCPVAALAKEKKAVLVTGDPEFKPLEAELKFRWLDKTD